MKTQCRSCPALCIVSWQQNRSRLLFSIHGRIGALDTVDGRIIWEIRAPKLSQHYTTAPFIVDQDIAVYAVAGMALAVQAKTGQGVWETDLFNSERLSCEQSAICYDRNKSLVYIATCQHVVALDIARGTVRWSVFIEQMRTTQPSLYLAFDDLLYIGGNGQVRCIDSLSGLLAKGFNPALPYEMKDTLTLTHPTQGNLDHNTSPVQQAWAICAQLPECRVSGLPDSSGRLTHFTKEADQSAPGKLVVSNQSRLEFDQESAHRDQSEMRFKAEAAFSKRSVPAGVVAETTTERTGATAADEDDDFSDDDILYQVPSKKMWSPPANEISPVATCTEQRIRGSDSSDECKADCFAHEPKTWGKRTGLPESDDDVLSPTPVESVAEWHDSSDAEDDPFAKPLPNTGNSSKGKSKIPAEQPNEVAKCDMETDLVALMCIESAHQPDQLLVGTGPAPPATKPKPAKPAPDLQNGDDDLLAFATSCLSDMSQLTAPTSDQFNKLQTHQQAFSAAGQGVMGATDRSSSPPVYPPTPYQSMMMQTAGTNPFQQKTPQNTTNPFNNSFSQRAPTVAQNVARSGLAPCTPRYGANQM